VIVLIDAVFSLDSEITAVGMVDQLAIMILAVVLSISLTMVLATRVSDFVNASRAARRAGRRSEPVHLRSGNDDSPA